ncbi:MAG: glycosyltransferase family 4 protein [Desulfomonile sp.]|nr:glycosyltransferase family 4 protein [Desulfomonile sp.]
MAVDNARGNSLSDRKLRFAVVCGGPTLRTWQARCVTHLIESGGAELALIVVDGFPNHDAEPAPNPLLFRFYLRRLVSPDAFRPASLDDIAARVSILTLQGSATKADIEKIREYRLDFILRFSFGNPIKNLEAETRYGIWSFLHDEEEFLGAGSFFREIGANTSVTRAVLLGQLAEGPAVVLREGWFPTIRYSYAEQIDAIAFECARWPAWICAHLHNGVDPFAEATPASAGVAVPLCTGETAAFMVRLFTNAIRKKITALYRHPQWAVGIVRSPLPALLKASAAPKVEFLDMGFGRTRFQADPFGIVADTGLTVLFEDFDIRRGKAHISCVQIAADGKMLPPQPVFVEPHHMSYPYLFQYDGKTYCVPETAHTGCIEIFEAVDFPLKWKKIATVGDNIAGLDTSIFRHEGLWWAAFTERGTGMDLNLFLMYAEQLTGPWKPHARNPVKTDIRSSRPAGTPFVHEGQLYRPAQDSSETYGGRVRINRVTKLTPDEFHEEEAAIVGPDPLGPYPDGMHTVCAIGDITLVDGLRHVFIGSEFRQVLAERLRKTAWGLWSLMSGPQSASATENAPKRVLVLGPVPPPQGGIASVIQDWVKSDLSREYTFEVFPTFTKDLVGTHKFLRLADHVRRFAALGLKLICTRPDIVHIHTSTAFRSTMVYLFLAKIVGRTAILHIHGSDWEGFYQKQSRLVRRLRRLALSLPDVIVVLNSFWVRWLIGIGISTDIRIVPNCLREEPKPDPAAVESVRRDLGFQEDDLVVLTVASICSWKGIFDLVEAIPKIVRQRNRVRFVLAGGEEEPGALKRLTDVLEQARVRRWVHVLGEVDRDRIAALLYSADLFLLPSWTEGMPIAVLEAMRAGVPVIATDVGAVPDMIADGESGFLIKPRHPEQIAEAVLSLSENESLRRTLAEGGRKVFEERFELSRCMKEMLALYRDVM